MKTSFSSLFEEEKDYDTWIERFEENGGNKEMEIEKIKKDEEINWSLFESKYVALKEGDTRDLVLSGWKQKTMKSPYQDGEVDGLSADVVEENGYEVQRVLETTSRPLINALKQHIVNAEKMGRKTLKVRILRTGSSKQTKYSVRALD